MAVVDPPFPALLWYPALAVQDSAPEQLASPGFTELSQRLLKVFDAGLHCDIVFTSGPGGPEVPAHRVVLRRNAGLRLDECSQASEPPRVAVPMSLENIRKFL